MGYIFSSHSPYTTTNTNTLNQMNDRKNYAQKQLPTLMALLHWVRYSYRKWRNAIGIGRCFSALFFLSFF
jgi:hypothetical protein